MGLTKYDNRGREIDYDAPGQMGRLTKPEPKLPHVPRFNQQLDRLVDYYNQRGESERVVHVTMQQIRLLMKVNPEVETYAPTGEENYRGHPLVVTEDP